MIRSGDLTWQKSFPHLVCNCLLYKALNFQLDISRHLAMAQDKPEGMGAESGGGGRGDDDAFPPAEKSAGDVPQK